MKTLYKNIVSLKILNTYIMISIMINHTKIYGKENKKKVMLF